MPLRTVRSAKEPVKAHAEAVIALREGAVEQRAHGILRLDIEPHKGVAAIGNRVHAAVGEDRRCEVTAPIARQMRLTKRAVVVTGAGAVERRTQVRLRGGHVWQYVRHAVYRTRSLNDRT